MNIELVFTNKSPFGGRNSKPFMFKYVIGILMKILLNIIMSKRNKKVHKFIIELMKFAMGSYRLYYLL